MKYIGQNLVNSSQILSITGEGTLKSLVPGSPDCRAQPSGDGLIGVNGQNCPFQMYSLSGVFSIRTGGIYEFCLSSAEG